MLPLISFETGRRAQTQSSGSRPLVGLRQQMEVWFDSEKEPRPRGHHARREIKECAPALARIFEIRASWTAFRPQSHGPADYPGERTEQV